LSKPVRIIFAIVLIVFLYFLWIGVGSVLFGWKHGGGAIPILIFLAMASFVWKTITKEKNEDKKIDIEKKE
jgi:hypothetical protein